MEGLQSVWGWQPALYLFLGGMGAGAFIAAMVALFKGGEESRPVVSVSVIASIVCLAVGLLLLLSELINPLRGLMMWQSFSNFTSWMTFGAWIVFAALIVFFVEALLVGKRSGALISKRAEGFGGKAPKLARAVGVVGVALGLCVAVYTGILLMSAPGVPLWDTPLLPCLFTVSALDTGVALVEVIAFVLRKRAPLGAPVSRLFQMSVVALVVLELVVLAVLLGTSLAAVDAGTHMMAVAGQSAEIVVSGVLALPFWLLVVVIGLVAPLAASLVALSGKLKDAHAVVLAGAIGALVGGCALRFVVILAGLHADPVLNAVASML